jgi:hypothetical protein
MRLKKSKEVEESRRWWWLIEGRLVGCAGCCVEEGGPSVHMTMARWFEETKGRALFSGAMSVESDLRMKD